MASNSIRGVYFPTLVQNVVASMTTARGFMFNIVPCALLVGIVAWSWRRLGWQRHRIYARLDLLAIPTLAGVALILTQYFQVGRIVAHGAPLFIWPVAQAFGLWARRGARPQLFFVTRSYFAAAISALATGAGSARNCARASSAKRPLRATSSSNVPDSMIRP
jgi:hypothetical protein